MSVLEKLSSAFHGEAKDSVWHPFGRESDDDDNAPPCLLYDHLAVGIKAVSVAALLCKALQGGAGGGGSLDALVKEDESPVTLADICSQSVIVEILRSSIGDSQAKVISEENLREYARSNFLASAVKRLNTLCPRSQLHSLLSGVGGRELGEWTSDLILESYERTHITNPKDLRDHDATPAPPFYFVVDPVDGTKGFRRGAQYAVGFCICETSTARPVASVIACPNLGDDGSVSNDQGPGCIFVALKGQGAVSSRLDSLLSRGDEEKASCWRRISAKQSPPTGKLTLLESFEPSNKVAGKAHSVVEGMGYKSDVIQMDGMGKFALISAGMGDVFLRFQSTQYMEKVWDILPGALLVEEARGCISHADGSPINATPDSFTLKNTSGLVVSANEELHEKALAVILSKQ